MLRSQALLRSIAQSCSPSHYTCLQQQTFLRTYAIQIKWRKPKEKIPVVDPNHFPLGQPVSGSDVINEDLAEFYSQPYELSISQLTKNGYHRFQKPYDPPEDAQEKVMSIAKSLNSKLNSLKLSEIIGYKLDDIKFKFNFLSRANEELEYRIPNSLLHLMETVGDVIQFYKTPVEVTTPYEELYRSKDLPPNLYIQKEPVRFHPETDTAFGGITAYPKTACIVTGLRAKQKFRGHGHKFPLPRS